MARFAKLAPDDQIARLRRQLFLVVLGVLCVIAIVSMIDEELDEVRDTVGKLHDDVASLQRRQDRKEPRPRVRVTEEKDDDDGDEG